MTEEEAKSKWCPMIRYERDLVNRSSPHPQNMNCIGSDCMMWRTTDPAIPEFKHPESGYCGLAGKP